MVRIDIKGKHNKLSKEEIRAMFQAAICILEFHKMRPKMNCPELQITIKILSEKGKMLKEAGGKASRKNPVVYIRRNSTFQWTFGIAIHETIHIYNDFPANMEEKLTSTLTAKLKPTIAKIYNILIDGVYERAAYIAHTKISYKPEGEDFYDKAENKAVELSHVGEKYRFRRKKHET